MEKGSRQSSPRHAAGKGRLGEEPGQRLQAFQVIDQSQAKRGHRTYYNYTHLPAVPRKEDHNGEQGGGQYQPSGVRHGAAVYLQGSAVGRIDEGRPPGQENADRGQNEGRQKSRSNRDKVQQTGLLRHQFLNTLFVSLGVYSGTISCIFCLIPSESKARAARFSSSSLP